MTSDREEEQEQGGEEPSTPEASSPKDRWAWLPNWLRFYNLRRNRSARLVAGTLTGAAVAVIVQLAFGFTGLLRIAFIGAIAGVVLTSIYDRNYRDVQLSEVRVSVPQFTGLTFMVNAEYRRVAWQLFIEVCTRVATQPLASEQGFIREALNSLHNLFGTTRELLKTMGASPAYIANESDATVEMLAVSMLNNKLRPFLSKWHPLLTEFERREGPEADDKEWDYNEEFRRELEKLRKEMLDYARGFGELAEVQNLDHFISSAEESNDPS